MAVHGELRPARRARRAEPEAGRVLPGGVRLACLRGLRRARRRSSWPSPAPRAGGGGPSATITCASSGARSTSSGASGARSAETASTRALASAIESARSRGGQQRVQRQRDGADPHRGEEGDDELDAVEQHERHALLGPHAESPQAARRAANEVVQLRVRDTAALGEQRHAPTVAGCQPTVDQVRGRVEGLYGVPPRDAQPGSVASRSRSAAVACSSTRSCSRSRTTPYASRASSTPMNSSSTSSSTFCGSRSSGSPYPAAFGLTVRIVSPGSAQRDCSFDGS